MKLKQIIFALTLFGKFCCSLETEIYDMENERVKTVSYMNIQNTLVSTLSYIKPFVQKGYDLLQNAAIPALPYIKFCASFVSKSVVLQKGYDLFKSKIFKSEYNLYDILTNNAKYLTLFDNSFFAVKSRIDTTSVNSINDKGNILLSAVCSSILPSVLYFTNNSKYLDVYNTAAVFCGNAWDYSYESVKKLGGAFLLAKLLSEYVYKNNFSMANLGLFCTSFIGTTALYNMWKMCFENFSHKNESIKKDAYNEKGEIVKKFDKNEFWYDVNSLLFAYNTISYSVKFINLGLLNRDVISSVALLFSWDFMFRPFLLKSCDFVHNSILNSYNFMFNVVNKASVHVDQFISTLRTEGAINYIFYPGLKFIVKAIVCGVSVLDSIIKWIISYPNIKCVVL